VYPETTLLRVERDGQHSVAQYTRALDVWIRLDDGQRTATWKLSTRGRDKTAQTDEERRGLAAPHCTMHNRNSTFFLDVLLSA